MSSSKSRARSQSAAAASARARLAAERERQAKRRRQLILVIVPLAVVLVLVGVLVVVRLVGAGTKEAATGGSSVITQVTSVPAATFDQVGVGTAANPPKRIDAPELKVDGKVKVLYVGGEFCPYCAAERWSVVAALSRFGTFSNLGQTTSSSTDVYPDTPTLTFHGASYTSDVVAFTGVETSDRENQPLDTLSSEDEKIFDTYNRPPYVEGQGGSIPYLNIGGRFVSSGASYRPEVLQGKTHEQIAAALADPGSDIAKGVDGAANLITAAVCASTGNQPAAVCSTAGVQSAAKQLG